jgi:hypothetical protein
MSMRKLVGVAAFGLAIISIALTARYGYKQADDEVDRWVFAGLYGAIAFSACLFDALAVKLWFKGARRTGLFIGLIAFLAFLVTFTNGLGGIASRADAVQARRQALTDTREFDLREVKRLEGALADLRFIPTDESAVAAAKHAAEVAASNRQAECDKRGPNCRQRELDDQDAARRLAEATTNKATTDRAKALEVRIAAVEGKLDKPVAVGHANPLGATLSNLFGAKIDNLTSWQQAIVALAFELCLVGMMVGYTVLGEVATPEPVAATEPTKFPEQPKHPDPVLEAPRPVREPLRLTVVQKELPASFIVALTELLDNAPKGKVEITDVRRAYATRTGNQMGPEEFPELTRLFCKKAGIKTAGNYLLGVRLARSGATASIPSTTPGTRGARSKVSSVSPSSSFGAHSSPSSNSTLTAAAASESANINPGSEPSSAASSASASSRPNRVM